PFVLPVGVNDFAPRVRIEVFDVNAERLAAELERHRLPRQWTLLADLLLLDERAGVPVQLLHRLAAGADHVDPRSEALSALGLGGSQTGRFFFFLRDGSGVFFISRAGILILRLLLFLLFVFVFLLALLFDLFFSLILFLFFTLVAVLFLLFLFD